MCVFFNNQLHQEIEQWENEGIIDSETGAKLRDRYPVTKRSMTQTLALLGSLLLGVGVILFFAANWQDIPRNIKLILIVLSFSLSYGTGYYLRHIRQNYPKVGYALICLGSILYGASIWLIAQIFHLEAENGMGYFLWYLGVIPIAYIFHSSINLSLSAFTLAAWFITGNYPLGWAHAVFPLLLFITVIPLSIRLKSTFNVIVSVLSLGLWVITLGVKLAYHNYDFRPGIICLLLFGLILYLIANQLKGKQFFAANSLSLLSFISLYIGFIPFTFHSFLKVPSQLPLVQFYYLVVAALLIIICLKIRDKKISLHDFPLPLVYVGIFLFFPALGNTLSLLIVNNVFLFIYILTAIYYGYLTKQPAVFNLSIIMFAIAVALKYFDLFFALMPRSFFFMSGGILLLLGSLFLEHKRRGLIKTMGRGEAK